jgi:hypothetical protein
LKRDPFDVAEANRALRTTVERIVLDPAERCLTIHWRDSEATSYLMVQPERMFDVVPGGFVAGAGGGL